MSGLFHGYIHAGNLNGDVDQRAKCRIETNHRLDQQLITRAFRGCRSIDGVLPLLHFEKIFDRQIDQHAASADACEQCNDDAEREPDFPHVGQPAANAMEQPIERSGVESNVAERNVAAEGTE